MNDNDDTKHSDGEDHTIKVNISRENSEPLQSFKSPYESREKDDREEAVSRSETSRRRQLDRTDADLSRHTSVNSPAGKYDDSILMMNSSESFNATPTEHLTIVPVSIPSNGHASSPGGVSTGACDGDNRRETRRSTNSDENDRQQNTIESDVVNTTVIKNNDDHKQIQRILLNNGDVVKKTDNTKDTLTDASSKYNVHMGIRQAKPTKSDTSAVNDAGVPNNGESKYNLHIGVKEIARELNYKSVQDNKVNQQKGQFQNSDPSKYNLHLGLHSISDDVEQSEYNNEHLEDKVEGETSIQYDVTSSSKHNLYVKVKPTLKTQTINENKSTPSLQSHPISDYITSKQSLLTDPQNNVDKDTKSTKTNDSDEIVLTGRKSTTETPCRTKKSVTIVETADVKSLGQSVPAAQARLPSDEGKHGTIAAAAVHRPHQHTEDGRRATREDCVDSHTKFHLTDISRHNLHVGVKRLSSKLSNTSNYSKECIPVEDGKFSKFNIHLGVKQLDDADAVGDREVQAYESNESLVKYDLTDGSKHDLHMRVRQMSAQSKKSILSKVDNGSLSTESVSLDDCKVSDSDMPNGRRKERYTIYDTMKDKLKKCESNDSLVKYDLTESSRHNLHVRARPVSIPSTRNISNKEHCGDSKDNLSILDIMGPQNDSPKYNDIPIQYDTTDISRHNLLVQVKPVNMQRHEARENRQTKHSRNDDQMQEHVDNYDSNEEPVKFNITESSRHNMHVRARPVSAQSRKSVNISNEIKKELPNSKATNRELSSQNDNYNGREKREYNKYDNVYDNIDPSESNGSIAEYELADSYEPNLYIGAKSKCKQNNRRNHTTETLPRDPSKPSVHIANSAISKYNLIVGLKKVNPKESPREVDTQNNSESSDTDLKYDILEYSKHNLHIGIKPHAQQSKKSVTISEYARDGSKRTVALHDGPLSKHEMHLRLHPVSKTDIRQYSEVDSPNDSQLNYAHAESSKNNVHVAIKPILIQSRKSVTISDKVTTNSSQQTLNSNTSDLCICSTKQVNKTKELEKPGHRKQSSSRESILIHSDPSDSIKCKVHPRSTHSKKSVTISDYIVKEPLPHHQPRSSSASHRSNSIPPVSSPVKRYGSRAVQRDLQNDGYNTDSESDLYTADRRYQHHQQQQQSKEKRGQDHQQPARAVRSHHIAVEKSIPSKYNMHVGVRPLRTPPSSRLEVQQDNNSVNDADAESTSTCSTIQCDTAPTSKYNLKIGIKPIEAVQMSDSFASDDSSFIRSYRSMKELGSNESVKNTEFNLHIDVDPVTDDWSDAVSAQVVKPSLYSMFITLRCIDSRKLDRHYDIECKEGSNEIIIPLNIKDFSRYDLFVNVKGVDGTDDKAASTPRNQRTNVHIGLKTLFDTGSIDQQIAEQPASYGFSASGSEISRQNVRDNRADSVRDNRGEKARDSANNVRDNRADNVRDKRGEKARDLASPAYVDHPNEDVIEEEVYYEAPSHINSQSGARRYYNITDSSKYNIHTTCKPYSISDSDYKDCSSGNPDDTMNPPC